MSDKQQITRVYCNTLLGDLLPIQLMYKGKIINCHPLYQFPGDWFITHSPKHWLTEEIMEDYLYKIFQYHWMGVSKHSSWGWLPSLAIFANFKGQVTYEVKELLKQNMVHVVKLPANCTNGLYPMDISINKHCGRIPQEAFQWIACEPGCKTKGRQRC